MAKRYNILTRCLAALALLFVYVASTSAILVGATTSPAEARGGRFKFAPKKKACRLSGTPDHCLDRA